MKQEIQPCGDFQEDGAEKEEITLYFGYIEYGIACGISII
jgi:hypothetical protein